MSDPNSAITNHPMKHRQIRFRILALLLCGAALLVSLSTVQADTVTPLATDPQSGLNPSWLVNVNGTLFFEGGDGVNGLELWKSDGTTNGTVLVKDFNTGAICSCPL